MWNSARKLEIWRSAAVDPPAEAHAELRGLLRRLEGNLPEDSNPNSPRAATERIDPLSGERTAFVAPGADPLRDERKRIEEAFENAAPGDPRAQLTLHWRFDDDLLSEKFGDGVRRSPAFPSMPCYSVRQWQSALVALAGCGERPALLSFRVGGVQEFIDKSRTTEDFWAGSFLLSQLMARALEPLLEGPGPEHVVFPSLRGQFLVDRWLRRKYAGAFRKGDLARLLPGPPAGPVPPATLSNAVLALVPYDEGAKLGCAMAEAFRGAWSEIAKAAREALIAATREVESRTRHWEAIWDAQIPDASNFELFWTVVPLGEGQSYEQWYRTATRAIEGRKTLRDFPQTSEPAVASEKCQLCGRRQSLRVTEEYERASSTRLWRRYAELGKARVGDREVVLRHRFRSSERLCAVCATRRLAWRVALEPEFEPKSNQRSGRSGFPSTASVAVAPFVQRALDDAGRLASQAAAWRRSLIELFRALGIRPLARSPYAFSGPLLAGPWPYLLRIDGDWWYPETYEIGRLRREFGPWTDESSIARSACNAKSDLESLLKTTDIGKPSRYLALLQGDGDQVGQWLTGDGGKLGAVGDFLSPRPAGPHHPAATKPRRPGLLLHYAIAEGIASLAPRIGDALRADGVFGFPVYTGGDDFLAFVPAANLPRALDAVERETTGPTPGRRGLTISAAALVLPESDPLAGAVREMLPLLKSEAKAGLQRDAAVVTVRRGSGQETLAGGPWTAGGAKTFEAVEKLRKAFAGPLSARYVSQAAALTEGLGADSIRLPDLLHMARALIERREDRALASTVEAIEQLLRISDNRQAHAWGRDAGGGSSAWARFVDWLLLARFLARQSKPEPETE